jgi:SAM-dependent methyltransferase
MKLHLGSGEKYLEGYVNIDYPESEQTVMHTKADVRADIRTLSYPDGSIDEVRSHHLFEHFSRAHALALLARWRRWLKPGGTIVIETPDFLNCAAGYARAVTQKRRMELGRHMLGSQEAPWAIHYDFWDAPKFKYVLKQYGFEKINVVSYQNAVAQHFPTIPFLNLAGNLLPASFYKKRGGHKLPNVLAIARKNDATINEEAVAHDILKMSLVGREDDRLLEVWMKQYREF